MPKLKLMLENDVKKLLGICLSVALVSGNAFGSTAPREGRLDARVKQVDYNEGQVYVIGAHYLQDSMVVFNPDEKIFHIGSGDPLAWQLVPVSNYLSIKPIEANADTNLNVLTKNKISGEVRSYVFELNASEADEKGIRSPNATFMLKFRYPEDELRKRMEALAAEEQRVKENTALIAHRKRSAQDWNMEYSFAGDTSLTPIRTFDDGQFTYFHFDEGADVPAIFLVGPNGGESLVNYHVSGKFIVVQKIGQQFMLRDGNRATCIFNDGFGNSGFEPETALNGKKMVVTGS